MILNPSARGFEFFQILRYSNLIVYLFVNIFYLINGLTDTVDELTLFLYLILVIQINYFLLKERHNPFIIIWTFFLIYFYSTRVLTIYWNSDNSSSQVLQRLGQATSLDINYTIIHILLANIMFYFGLRGINGEKNDATISQKYEISHKRIVILLILFIFYVQLLAFIKIEVISSFLNNIISINGILLIAFASLFFPINRYYKLIIIYILLGYAILRFLSGSRSILIIYLHFLLITMLANNIYLVKNKKVLLFILMILISIISFPMATYLREIAGVNYQDINYIDYFVKGIEYYLNFNYDPLILIPIFDRAGFLDFTIDAIKNADSYSYVINLQWQIKSIIDGLTPGFDLFDKPLIANALIGIYSDNENFFNKINFEGYQSDQINFYGEIFILFGPIFSLPIYLIFGIFFKSMYKFYIKKNEFNNFVWKSFILYVFILFINSFGLDWTIINSISLFISIYLILLIIKNKNNLGGI